MVTLREDLRAFLCSVVIGWGIPQRSNYDEHAKIVMLCNLFPNLFIDFLFR
jgi:hypothetical protein